LVPDVQPKKTPDGSFCDRHSRRGHLGGQGRWSLRWPSGTTA